MTEIERRGDLRDLIKELEEKDKAEAPGRTSSKSGFVPVKEAATMLGVSEEEINKLIRRGEVTATRIGRRQHVAEKDIAKLVTKTREKERIRLADPNRLLTVSEVAEILRFSEAQIYDMLNRKILLGFRVGAGAGSWRVLKKDLDTYIAKKREESLKETEHS